MCSVGFGAGKVIKLNVGYVLNVYAETQPSIYRAGWRAELSGLYGHQTTIPADYKQLEFLSAAAMRIVTRDIPYPFLYSRRVSMLLRIAVSARRVRDQ